MSQINSDLIEFIEDTILTPAQFVQWVKGQNPDLNKEFIANPVTVVDKNGDEVPSLPGRWKVVDIFQSGQVMYRQK